VVNRTFNVTLTERFQHNIKLCTIQWNAHSVVLLIENIGFTKTNYILVRINLEFLVKFYLKYSCNSAVLKVTSCLDDHKTPESTKRFKQNEQLYTMHWLLRFQMKKKTIY